MEREEGYKECARFSLWRCFTMHGEGSVAILISRQESQALGEAVGPRLPPGLIGGRARI
jgi:hypothetical protein